MVSGKGLGYGFLFKKVWFSRAGLLIKKMPQTLSHFKTKRHTEVVVHTNLCLTVYYTFSLHNMFDLISIKLFTGVIYKYLFQIVFKFSA